MSGRPTGPRTGRSEVRAPSLRARRPVLRFVVIFAILLATFFAVTALPFFWRSAMPPFLHLNARAAAIVLSGFGVNASVDRTMIITPECSLDIQRGCDAIDAIAIFAAAMLAFPAPWRRKLGGIVGGVLVLMVLNQVRILSLYLVARHAPAAFETVHVEIWQPLFIALAIGLWLAWVTWALRRGDQPNERTRDATAIIE